MGDHLIVPSEDVRALIDAGVREAVAHIVNSVSEHLTSAHDEDAEDQRIGLARVRRLIHENQWTMSDLEAEPTLDEVRDMVDAHAWDCSDLNIEPDLDAIKDAIDNNGWTAGDLEIAVTGDIDEAVGEHGTVETLRALRRAERDASNPAHTVARLAYNDLTDAQREDFLSSIGAVKVADADKAREAARAELLSKLAALLA